jgi:hypothetical protein
LIRPVIAQSKDPVVPVSNEPSHHIRFDNGRVRVHDVQVPLGKWTEFHEHSWDNFFVFMIPTTQAYEFSDGRHGTREVKAGDVGFSSTAAGPYTHRVSSQGVLPLHVVDIEILNNATLGSGVAGAKRPESSFKIVLENPRGRAYDIVLHPGQSTAVFARPANTDIFAVSGGRMSETAEGKAPRLWDSEPGDFRWNDNPEKLTIKNEGSRHEEFVEIEIFLGTAIIEGRRLVPLLEGTVRYLARCDDCGLGATI